MMFLNSSKTCHGQEMAKARKMKRTYKKEMMRMKSW